MNWSGELCWWYIIPQMMFLLLTRDISIQRAWNASLEVFSKTVQFSDMWMKRPTPPDARGVGKKSKTYRGMQEKNLFSFEFVIWFLWHPLS